MPERIKHAPLDRDKVKSCKGEVHLIKDECKGCGYCIEFCPKKVLEESDEINARGVHPPRVVHEEDCVMCGFCTTVCPDFAIYVVEKPQIIEKSEVKGGKNDQD
jgi:2-oxoglutarate ferredoxin oxidoreductase subunit delta